MLQTESTFNGHYKPNSTTVTTSTDTSGTITYPYVPYVEYDKIEFCPFCGKKLNDTTSQFTFCPYCGKQLPHTTTRGMFIYHWNFPDGTPTWPTYPIVTCNTANLDTNIPSTLTH